MFSPFLMFHFFAEKNYSSLHSAMKKCKKEQFLPPHFEL